MVLLYRGREETLFLKEGKNVAFPSKNLAFPSKNLGIEHPFLTPLSLDKDS